MDTSSLYKIKISTPRLVLRVPKEEKDFQELGEVLASGIQKPQEPHFMDESLYGKSAEDQAKSQKEFVEKSINEWNNNNWHIPLGVFLDNKTIGLVTLFSNNFPITHGFGASYWIGLAHQGKGYGTEAFQAALHFAFDTLTAEEAYAGAYSDNVPSIHLMEKLGFVFNGEYWMARNGQRIKDKRMRLPKENFQTPDGITIEGAEEALPLFQ